MNPFNLLGKVFFPVPKTCPLCGKKTSQPEICETCREDLNVFRGAGFCRRCGTFGYRGEKCPNCRTWPAYFIENKALLPYTDRYGELIKNYKFRRQGWYIEVLLELLEEHLEYADNLLVISVPLHPEREAERGFNQARYFAEKLAYKYSLEERADILFRDLPTPHQIGLTKSARQENLAGAFSVKNASSIKGENILLVDDVLTTGATLLECARTLKKNGAAKIYARTLAAGTRFV